MLYRNLLIYLVRPAGFEPAAYGFEVCLEHFYVVVPSYILIHFIQQFRGLIGPSFVS